MIAASEQLPVIVVGSGGHARVLVETLQLLGRRVLGVTDSNPRRAGKLVGGVLIEGSHDLVYEHATTDVELAIAVGSVAVPEARRNNYIKFASRGYRFATIVHPSATVSASAKLAQGSQVMAGAIVQSGTVVGVNAIINTHLATGRIGRPGVFGEGLCASDVAFLRSKQLSPSAEGRG